MPRDRPPLAVDAQPQIILIAWCDLAGPQHAARAFAIPEHDVNVVIKPPPRDEDREVGGDLPALQTGDKSGEMISVRADVAQASRGTAARRIGAPFGLLLSG